MSEASNSVDIESLMEDLDNAIFDEESTGSVRPEVKKVNCLSLCGGQIHFLEGSISVKCSTCGTINCFRCKSIHELLCQEHGAAGATHSLVDSINDKMSRVNRPRAVKRSIDFNYMTTVTPNRAYDEEPPAKKGRASTLVKVDKSKATMEGKGRMNVCHVCSYRTVATQHFITHLMTKKHKLNMKN